MNEILWLIMLLLNFLLVIGVYRIYGKIGLYALIPISIIIANIQVTKLIDLFGVTTTLGNIVYASSFLVTDILSENYGKAAARKAAFIGFISLISMTLFMNLALAFQPSAADTMQASLKQIFGIMPRLALASLVAYGISQAHDVWAYHFWKKKNSDYKYIWLRNNLSTAVSQFLDTAIFTLIAFVGSYSWSVLFELFITAYVLKFIVAICDTPFIYLSTRWFQKGKIKDE